MKKIICGLVCCAVAVPAFAQTATPSASSLAPQAQPVAAIQASPVAVLEQARPQNILRAGLEVPLRTREELTTKKKLLRPGQRIQLEVAANVEGNGIVVIPVGTPAVGEITEVRNKGMWGKSGYISARILSLRIGDRQVRLSGTFDDKGVTGTAGVVGAVVLVPIAGFFMTGTSAMIPMGSAVKAFLDEDIVFSAVAAAPQVLEVPVAAPTAPVTGEASAVPAAPVATPVAAPAAH